MGAQRIRDSQEGAILKFDGFARCVNSQILSSAPLLTTFGSSRATPRGEFFRFLPSNYGLVRITAKRLNARVNLHDVVSVNNERGIESQLIYVVFARVTQFIANFGGLVFE